MVRNIKIICIGISLALAVSTATGCAKKDIAGESVPSKTVKTITTTSESYVETVDYEGFVTAKSIKNLSFEQSGKISAIYAQVGQRIKEGDLLAEVDALMAQNMIFQVEAERLNLSKVEAVYEAEQLNLEKIKNSYTSSINTLKRSYDKAKDSCEKFEILFNLGAISKKEYDDEKFAFETIANELYKTEQDYAADLALQEKSVDNARKNIDLQKLSINRLESDMSSVMLSPADGYIIDVSANAGEIIGAGAPVIILKSIEQIVTIGVSVNDLPKISTGMKVDIDFSGTSFSGTVITAGQYPDESSMTYSVEIALETNDIPAGTIVSVKIPTETRSAVLIPINAMFAVNGVNYVYCAEKDEGGLYKAVMKEVLFDDVYGSNVIALNLVPGIIIVADDVKSIKENDWLSIIDRVLE
ncbi:MAG: efflux RND transporter periplasmic adaptor subunit [Peptococcaceae bacterium]